MSITETVLTFVVAPAAIILVITGLVYAGGARRARRYRPGRPYEFRPVWFLSAPEQLASQRNGAAALPEGARRAELTAGGDTAPGDHRATQGEQQLGETGGASDRW